MASHIGKLPVTIPAGVEVKIDGQSFTAKGVKGTDSYEIPEGIEFELPNPNQVIVKGIDKQAVGQCAANIRKLRAPEPYKGKGVKYSDERILRKAGKAGK